MAEQLFECAVCHCIYRISAKACPRCNSSNYARKKYHGGFYDIDDAKRENEYQRHNSHYNVHHHLTFVAWDGVIRRD